MRIAFKILKNLQKSCLIPLFSKYCFYIKIIFFFVLNQLLENWNYRFDSTVSWAFLIYSLFKCIHVFKRFLIFIRNKINVIYVWHHFWLSSFYNLLKVSCTSVNLAQISSKYCSTFSKYVSLYIGVRYDISTEKNKTVSLF